MQNKLYIEIKWRLKEQASYMFVTAFSISSGAGSSSISSSICSFTSVVLGP